MKVEIKADGELFIRAETELESYALKKWCEENRDNLKTKTLIKTGLDNKDG